MKLDGSRLGRVCAVALALGVLGVAVPAQAGAASPIACSAVAIPVSVAGTTQHLGGTFCRPATKAAEAAFVLVPGGTYDHVYWDFPYKPGTYSFAHAMARGGYAALSLDLLGEGSSSAPLSLEVTTTAQASVVHQAIEWLRETGVNGFRYERIYMAGHSLGSTVAVIEASTYNDEQGTILTGYTHHPNVVKLAEIFASFRPADLYPAFQAQHLDPGYVTTAPGTRYDDFAAPGEVDPQVLAVDEATKSTATFTDVPDAVTAILSTQTRNIHSPVLDVMGTVDQPFCSSQSICASANSVLAAEKPYYTTCLSAFVMPGVGHDLNLAPSAPTYQRKVLAWANAVTSGACPTGPFS